MPHGHDELEQSLLPLSFSVTKACTPAHSVPRAAYHDFFLPDGHVPAPNSEDDVVVERGPLNSVDSPVMDSVEVYRFLSCGSRQGQLWVHGLSQKLASWATSQCHVLLHLPVCQFIQGVTICGLLTYTKVFVWVVGHWLATNSVWSCS